jgi:arylsulfatase A-like enzyme
VLLPTVLLSVLLLPLPVCLRLCICPPTCPYCRCCRYVQQALCAPSRTVMLTGRRPDRSRVWAIGPYFRDTTGPDWVTLPQAFKQAGYITGGAGKLFHTGAPSGLLMETDNVTGKEYVVRYGDDYPMSWTLPYNQNIDIQPADGQYPNDTNPKYPQKFPKPKVRTLRFPLIRNNRIHFHREFRPVWVHFYG